VEQDEDKITGIDKGVAIVKLQPLYITGADEQDRTADLLITNHILLISRPFKNNQKTLYK
jgi:hypothetical protein